jgi:cell division protease FtsH
LHLTDFTNAVERIVAGLEKKNRLPIPKERELIACYELGHAIVAIALPGQDPVHKISIISLVIGALGNTIQRPTEDRFLMTEEELGPHGGAARRPRCRIHVLPPPFEGRR